MSVRGAPVSVRGAPVGVHTFFTWRLPLGNTGTSAPVKDPSELTATAQARSDVIKVGPLQVIPADHLALAGGHTLMLSSRELHLLIELARRSGRIVGRDELSRVAWGRSMRAGDRSVDVYVRKLRVKLEQAAPGWRFIHTHVGFGYRLAPERSRDTHRTFTSR